MNKIFEFDTVTSTFDKISDYPAKHLLTVVAKKQTKGSGRLGRSWQSDEGGLYFSTYIKADYFKDDIGFSTVVCAVAVSRVLSEYGKVHIKWPNDIVMNKKKICGILTKMSSTDGKFDYIVAGIGINTNVTHFQSELTNASSVLIETDIKCDNLSIANKILENIDKLIKSDKRTVIEEYKKLCITLGSEVIVHHITDGEYKGKCTDITDDGKLLVECDGKTICVNSGEVSVRGLYGYV